MSNSKKKSLSGNAVQKNPGKEQSASSIRKWMGIIPILILTYLVYTPALKNSITGWDDNNYITENKDIRQLNTDFIKKSFAPHSGIFRCFASGGGLFIIGVISNNSVLF